MNRELFSEAIGSFALVFAGCGAIVVNDLYGNSLGHLGVSAVFGLVVMAVIYAIGNTSGAHINPAVTIAFALGGRFPKAKIGPFVLAQIGGATLGALALRVLFPEHLSLGITIPVGTWQQAFLMESILSFLLMFVILNVSTGHMEKGIMAGVAIGGTVALEALIGGPVTGASMNPARSIAPALISGSFDSLWIYLAAPTLGALLAVPTCRMTQGDSCCT